MTRLEEISLVARCVGFDDRRAFARLVDEYHQPLLRFLTGMCGDKKIAAITNMPENTVKSHLQRARTVLKQILQHP